METVVGIGPQTLEVKRRIFHYREKDRADPNSRRKHLARRRVNRRVQPGAPTEGASRRARTNRKISSAIQRTGEAVAACNCGSRECRHPQSEIASGADVRACG